MQWERQGGQLRGSPADARTPLVSVSGTVAKRRLLPGGPTVDTLISVAKWLKVNKVLKGFLHVFGNSLPCCKAEYAFRSPEILNVPTPASPGQLSGLPRIFLGENSV